jgi:hypothetical protein
MTAANLGLLQKKSVEVLELLKANLPEKNGVINAWKFKKAHSILHKPATRCGSLSCLAGPRISAPKDLNIVICQEDCTLHKQ